MNRSQTASRTLSTTATMLAGNVPLSATAPAQITVARQPAPSAFVVRFRCLPAISSRARTAKAAAQKRWEMITTFIAASSSAFREQDHANRLHQDDEIEQKRMILHVIEIIRQFLPRVLKRSAIRMVDLGPAGDARLDRVPLAVERDLRGELFDEIGPLGPRSDEAHIAPQHIEKLR